MANSIATEPTSIPIILVNEAEWSAWSKKQNPEILAWTKAHKFEAKAGTTCIFLSRTGECEKVLAGISFPLNIWAIADLADRLQAGNYHVEAKLKQSEADDLMLGFLLGCYRFDAYKTQAQTRPVINLSIIGCNLERVELIAAALNNARDLVNMPANDLGPAELAKASQSIAKKYKALYTEIVGKQLLAANYPAIYEVGKASSRPPRLIDIRWGNPKHPKITLVGKGVCFDSGGLDIKPSSGMKLMKKDMGGAAAVLALAQIIMAEKLPVYLRVLIPAVENSISGNAYRPFDIINTRKGLKVEVGNTDAEGRLILCDALYEADEEKPDLLIDCATLTGAARTALGPEIPAFFTQNDELANSLQHHANLQHDPLWRLPLWTGYKELLKSANADINSAPDGPYAGAITAALYLNEFITNTKNWLHIDMMAWNVAKRPGRPAGGEAMAVRALYSYIKEKIVK